MIPKGGRRLNPFFSHLMAWKVLAEAELVSPEGRELALVFSWANFTSKYAFFRVLKWRNSTESFTKMHLQKEW